MRTAIGGVVRSPPLAAVVFLMEVGTELLAVIRATLEISLAAAVTVVHPAITGTVAVALALVTRSRGSAATSGPVVTAAAPLVCKYKGLKAHMVLKDNSLPAGGSLGTLEGLWNPPGTQQVRKSQCFFIKRSEGD